MDKNIVTMDMIKEGRCQFDSKDAKTFRSICAKYHNAKHSIKDNLGLANESIGNKSAMIKVNLGLIDKLNKGESIIGKKSIEELVSENESLQSEIDALRDAKHDYNEKMLKDTNTLVDMLKGYVSAKEYKSATKESMTLVIAQFLSDNGVVPCMDTISRIVDAWGKREQNSNGSATNGMLNSYVTYPNWVKITLNELVDIMQEVNMLPTHKYTFVPKALRNKSENK